MWKKDGDPDQPVAPRHEPAPAFERAAPPPRPPGERATIGPSITIHGEVSGDEDLLIQGRVDGAVNLKQHSVTVGPEGEVKADITARVITVEGRVTGNLKAEQQAILRSTSVVEGDIAAPRVVLEDGARFRGGVDMGDALERSRTAAAGQTKGQDAGRRGEPASASAGRGEEKTREPGAQPSAQVAR